MDLCEVLGFPSVTFKTHRGQTVQSEGLVVDLVLVNVHAAAAGGLEVVEVPAGHEFGSAGTACTAVGGRRIKQGYRQKSSSRSNGQASCWFPPGSIKSPLSGLVYALLPDRTLTNAYTIFRPPRLLRRDIQLRDILTLAKKDGVPMVEGGLTVLNRKHQREHCHV